MSRRPLSSMERRPVSQRLGMYFLGVAIGLVLVGALLTARRVLVPGTPVASQAPAPDEPMP